MTHRLLPRMQRVLILSLLVGLVSRCTQQAVDKQADGPCRIRQVDIKETARQGTRTLEENTDQTTYDYHALGRISLMARRYEKHLAGQSAVVYSYAETSSYAYDKDGFLTAQSSEARWQPVDNQASTNTNTLQSTYAYTNGRLTQQVNLRTNRYGLQTKIVSTYTYDATGSLTTRTDETTYPAIPATAPEKPAFPNGITAVWTYQNGKAVDYVEKLDGGVDVRPYTFQNGFLQTQTGSNYRTLFTYDSQGHSVKQEFWVNGQLNSYTEYTYTQDKLPPGLTPGHFKGFPTVTNTAGVAGVMRTAAYYNSTPAGVLMRSSSTQVQHKLTGAGYLQSSDQATTTYQNEAGVVLNQFTTTTMYTYDGSCD
ncbi:hypothetical protein [Fibrella arboris]|uniref:hypothetical protein n=1 Tax=Fibrella arboris TaxID=3242486 RepID=UPI0035213AA7